MNRYLSHTLSSSVNQFQNENTTDINPYTYPYFHSDESTPLLYHLIVTHFGNDNLSCMHSDNNNTTNDHDAATAARKRKFIAKRIKARCQLKPNEATWVDTCGENALFRFCQLIRFCNGYEITNTYQNNIPSLSLSSSYVSLYSRKLDTTAELIFFVFQCLVDVIPQSLSALNKWGETPLHQFLGHCGFCLDNESSGYGNNSFFYNHDAGVRKNTTNGNDAIDTASPSLTAKTTISPLLSISMSSSKMQNTLSNQFLELMLRLNPSSVYQTNYQNALPLHLACSLAQLDTEHNLFSSSDKSISMDKLGTYFHTTDDISMTSTSSMMMMDLYDDHQYLNSLSSFASNGTFYTRAKDHLSIIKRLVEYYPKGLFDLDMNGCTPLFRSVDSIHCDSNITRFLLVEMERILNGMDKSTTSMMNMNFHGEVDQKTLFRRAIMGMKQPSRPYHLDCAENGESKNVFQQLKNEAQIFASPMEAIWKTLFMKRRVEKEVYWLGDNNVSYTSINDIVQAAFHNNYTKNYAAEGKSNSSSHRQHRLHHMKQHEKALLIIKQMGQIWEKILYLICSAYHGSTKWIEMSNENRDDDHRFMLHAGVYCGVPSCILTLLLHLYPEDLLKGGLNGETPLTLSIKTPTFEERWLKDSSSSNCCPYADFSGFDDGITREDRIIYLLGANRRAAEIPNGCGRLPLHLAIDNNLHWNHGLYNIFCENLDAVSMKDPTSQFLPFMMMASSKKKVDSASSLSTTRNPHEQLTNTYLLLKEDPTVLNMTK
mmetsp:Transcript_19193/g.22194  ORF Transcript_19193/g.22194 Transcript_19193/m.22194 type:complete len:768 (+) Transcript_19193:183-2486(+)